MERPSTEITHRRVFLAPGSSRRAPLEAVQAPTRRVGGAPARAAPPRAQSRLGSASHRPADPERTLAWWTPTNSDYDSRWTAEGIVELLARKESLSHDTGHRLGEPNRGEGLDLRGGHPAAGRSRRLFPAGTPARLELTTGAVTGSSIGSRWPGWCGACPNPQIAEVSWSKWCPIRGRNASGPACSRRAEAAGKLIDGEGRRARW